MPASKTTMGWRSVDEVRADNSVMIFSKVVQSDVPPSNIWEYFNPARAHRRQAKE